ncbi:unnamed protein product [Strongylus vulgaris]|uniref:Uncharacterized protein n=1 Tax=Strongylus vulgaris TaxID=40348 RepID=A0A3P7JK42_STRVU|nr:unnamed protein product [Strongylus vulgaris]
MFERSSRYGNVDRRTTWGATYKRMFRSVYPPKPWQQVEDRAFKNATEYDTMLMRSVEPQSIAARPSPLSEFRSSKRVSIDESEARSLLSKRPSESGSAQLHNAVDDDDVRDYIQDIMKREFRDECKNVTIRQLNHHPEAVFNKTLKISGPEKVVVTEC